MVGDSIGDMITRIRNAGAVGHLTTSIPYSAMKKSIADLLKREGYLKSVSEKGKTPKTKALEVELSYRSAGVPRITEIKRISKPGKRVYVSIHELVPVQRGRGVAVLSTPKGIITDKEAKKEKVGGELLFTAW